MLGSRTRQRGHLAVPYHRLAAGQACVVSVLEGNSSRARCRWLGVRGWHKIWAGAEVPVVDVQIHDVSGTAGSCKQAKFSRDFLETLARKSALSHDDHVLFQDYGLNYIIHVQQASGTRTRADQDNGPTCNF